MRGDLRLAARLLLRPRGLVGLAVTVAGVVAVAALYLPWYEVRWDVEMLGASRSGSVAALAGWRAQPWVWVGGAVAVAAAAAGLAVAVDRPPPVVREILLTASIVLAVVAGAAALVAPPRSRFLVDPRLRRLQEVVETLPRDVEVEFSIANATGLWVSLAAAGVLLLSVYANRQV